MTHSNSSSKKKAVLIRVPEDMYSDLLNLSAAETLLQRRSVSVPSLILDLLDVALKRQRVNYRG